MTQVTIRRNSIDPTADLIFNEISEVGDFLYHHFETWPETAVVYQDHVGEENIIPIKCEQDVWNLNKLEGHIIVVVYPAGLFAIGALVLAANVATILLAGRKKSKSDQVTAQRKIPTAGSPNNGLSQRSNRERLNERIPEIFGTVRSIPDLLTNPHIEYRNNTEAEFAYLCVGRGEYEISDIREDETKIEMIAQASLEIYGPNTSPNSGTPQITVGKAIDEPFVYAKKFQAVNGQKLFAPNTTALYSNSRMLFYPDGRIEVDNTVKENSALPDISFTDFFQVGEKFEIYGSFNTDGIYDIAGVDSSNVYLNDPTSVNGYWTNFSTSGTPNVGGMYFITPGDRSVGPFVLEDVDEVYCNIIAEQGLFKDDGTDQYAEAVWVQAEVQQVDLNDVPFGSPYVKTMLLQGSANSRSRIGVTLKTTLPFSGRVQVKVKRNSNTDLGWTGEVSDEVKLESLLAVKDITASHFGDITTIRVVNYANVGSIAIQDRKLNMLASRVIPVKQPGGAYVDGTTSKFADIMRFVCLDSKIGNRNISEIDVDNFYATQDAIEAYFGTSKAIEFNYTFDDEEFTFEETMSVIAECVHCNAFRQGSVIRLFFEKETANSSLLFNHRNKIPRTETRTLTFGISEDKDGVELEYVDDSDGAKVHFYLPSDQSAVNPLKVAQIGVKHKLQAYFHAHRLWNKLQYQNCAIEFDALQEASILSLNERILVADNTRPNTFDGEVISQDGLTLTLSQDFVFEVGESYTIFLQLPDGSISSRAITAGSLANQVILASSLAMPLSVESDYYARATYEIVQNGNDRKRAFLVDEKSSTINFIVNVKAINYDDRYYQADDDFIDLIVDIDGNLI